MIQKGWFLEGQTDQKETCLITSTETYRQYTETQKALEQRNEEECRKRQQETEQQKQISPEVQEVLDKGEAYIQKSMQVMMQSREKRSRLKLPAWNRL